MIKIKLITILISILLIAFISTNSIYAQDTCYVNFDVNGDSLGWSITDLIHLMGILNGDSTYTEFVGRADVNFDCVIDDGDIEIFYCILNGGPHGFMLCMGERYWSCCDPLMTVGACCLPDDSCTIRSEENCLAMGGGYMGDGTYCDDYQACCCKGDRGNADCSSDDLPNVTDLVFMVKRAFIADFSCCEMEEDVDGNGQFNITDLVYMVNYVFKGGPAPLPCY